MLLTWQRFPVVEPGGCIQFSCQTVDSTDRPALSCCWPTLFLPTLHTLSDLEPCCSFIIGQIRQDKLDHVSSDNKKVLLEEGKLL